MNDKPMKLARTHEYIIKALGRVLEEEDPSNPYSNEDMFGQVLKKTRGQVNPVIVKEYVNNIMNDRY